MSLNDSPEINHHGRDFVAWLRHSSEISIIPLKSTVGDKNGNNRWK
jgi:hypothetical protein